MKMYNGQGGPKEEEEDDGLAWKWLLLAWFGPSLREVREKWEERDGTCNGGKKWNELGSVVLLEEKFMKFLKGSLSNGLESDGKWKALRARVTMSQ